MVHDVSTRGAMLGWEGGGALYSLILNYNCVNCKTKTSDNNKKHNEVNQRMTNEGKVKRIKYNDIKLESQIPQVLIPQV